MVVDARWLVSYLIFVRVRRFLYGCTDNPLVCFLPGACAEDPCHDGAWAVPYVTVVCRADTAGAAGGRVCALRLVRRLRHRKGRSNRTGFGYCDDCEPT
jgi:hypothetical protein